MTDGFCEICGFPVGSSVRHERRCLGRHHAELCSNKFGKRLCPRLMGEKSGKRWRSAVSPCFDCELLEFNPIIYYDDDEHQSLPQRVVRAYRIMKLHGRFVWARADLFDPKPVMPP